MTPQEIAAGVAADKTLGYRMLRSRNAYVGAVDGESLADCMRRTADAIDKVEADECSHGPDITEGVSHAVFDWSDESGWSALLVIE